MAEPVPPFKVACLQLTSTPDLAENVRAVRELAHRARDAGADLLTTPECVSMMEPRRRRALEKAAPEEGNEAVADFAALARETGAWFLAGSLVVKVAPDRLANRSYLFSPDGAVAGRYDKIHMFDVDLEGGESYRESRTYRPGSEAVVAETPWGPLGMTVCYDLRFPGLYRDLAAAGARYLSIPSAFTRTTGRAHWHALLRARAIENGCYVIAPAQCGVHAGNRKTFGHSLVVDPWGEVLADGGEEPCVVVAEVDPARVDEVRRMLPSLGHGRAYAPSLSAGEKATRDPALSAG